MQSNLVNWTLSTITPQLNRFTPPLDMREAISHIKALPPLPGSALRIAELAGDPEATANQLAEIIELDPLLTAQIIRWASSSFYGYKGKITTVHDAITRVLGFNFVLDVAIGLLVLAPLKTPREGVAGIRMFWIHALTSTRLMKLMAQKMPAHHQPQPQETFLAALLHNIGFALFGHEFPEEFAHLNNMISANPSLSVFNLENFAFGISHTEIGTWLMNSWSMPRAITDIVFHHHNPYYRGEHYQLNLLTFANDCLLSQIGIGDSANQVCPDEVWTELELDPLQCRELLDSLQAEIEQITAMADALTS